VVQGILKNAFRLAFGIQVFVFFLRCVNVKEDKDLENFVKIHKKMLGPLIFLAPNVRGRGNSLPHQKGQIFPHPNLPSQMFSLPFHYLLWFL